MKLNKRKTRLATLTSLPTGGQLFSGIREDRKQARPTLMGKLVRQKKRRVGCGVGILCGPRG